jgi:hypothetical protein
MHHEYYHPMGVWGKLLCRLAPTLRPFADVGGLAANEAIHLDHGSGASYWTGLGKRDFASAISMREKGVGLA